MGLLENDVASISNNRDCQVLFLFFQKPKNQNSFSVQHNVNIWGMPLILRIDNQHPCLIPKYKLIFTSPENSFRNNPNQFQESEIYVVDRLQASSF